MYLKKNPQVRFKMKDVLHKNNKLSNNYQSKLGYDTLIQNVVLKEE